MLLGKLIRVTIASLAAVLLSFIIVIGAFMAADRKLHEGIATQVGTL